MRSDNEFLLRMTLYFMSLKKSIVLVSFVVVFLILTHSALAKKHFTPCVVINDYFFSGWNKIASLKLCLESVKPDQYSCKCNTAFQVVCAVSKLSRKKDQMNPLEPIGLNTSQSLLVF